MPSLRPRPLHLAPRPRCPAAPRPARRPDWMRFLHHLTCAAPLLVYLYNVKTHRYTYRSHNLAPRLGFPGDLTAEQEEALIHPDDRAAWQRANTRAEGRGPSEETSAVIEIEFRLRRADDAWAWFQRREIVFERAANGHPRLLLGVLEEVSQRKQAEETQRLTQFSIEQAALAMIWIDAAGRVVYLNAAACQSLGRTPEELLGRSPAAISPELAFLADPAAWDELRGRRALRLTGRAVTPNGGFPVELQLNHLTYAGSEMALVCATDLSSRADRERELQASAAANEALRRVSDPGATAAVYCDLAQAWLDAAAVALLHPFEASETLVSLPGRGAWAPLDGRPLSPALAAIYAQAAAAPDSLCLPAAAFPDLGDLVPGMTIVLHPLRVPDAPPGVLALALAQPPRPADLRLLAILSEIGAGAMQRSILAVMTEQRMQHLLAVRAIETAIAASTNLDETLRILVLEAREKLQVSAVDVLVYHRRERQLRYAAGAGFSNHFAEFATIQPDAGVAGWVAREGRPLRLARLMDEPNFRRGPFLAAEGFESYVGQPLHARGEFVGVLEIFQRGPLCPGPLWWELVDVLTQQAGVAVADAHLVERLRRNNAELQQANDATLESLARALELRDQETAGHSDRVVNLTLELAQALNVPVGEWEHLRRGALLHDFGKMGIPDAIFRKPGPLDAAEWEVMRRHPAYAYNWLVNIPFLRPALDIPYCHHEKWDGSGYPRGLRGPEIPLSARLFAIVDVWDALTSDRPYRAAWSAARTRAYLQEQAGSHFDPQVVDAFLPLVAA